MNTRIPVLDPEKRPGRAPCRHAMALRALLALTAAGPLTACDGEAPATPDGGGDAGGGDAGGGDGSGGGGAAAPGCAPGELATASGCEPAGIPPDACGAGFEPGDRACAPVLPPAACPAGTMAVPGETACREVAPCGDGTWGDIPVDAETQFVDGAYAGSDSDGTAMRPWPTIGEGLGAAAPGGLVAIAAGTYPEEVRVDRPVRLRGRCPALVEIAGAGAETVAAVLVGAGADAAEIRGVAVRSAGQGIAVTGARGVVVDEVWVAGAGAQGVRAYNEQGPAQLTVRGSLIEGARSVGVHSAGAELVVESSVVRGTSESGGPGAGANRGAGGAPASLTLRASVVEQSRGAGVHVIAAEAIIEESVIRDSVAVDADAAGMGVFAMPNTQGQPGHVTLRRSVVERNQEAGIWVQGSSAAVEETVVRDTRSYPDDLETGWGVYIAANLANSLRSEATLKRVVVEQSRYAGVAILGSDVSLDGLLVRDTLPRDEDQNHGVGLAVASSGQLRGDVTARGSLFERSRSLGVFIEGADVTLEGVAVRRTLPRASDERFGRGIEVHARGGRSHLVLRSSLVEESVESGLTIFGSTATLEDTIIRDTRSSSAGLLGNGVTIIKEVDDAEATLTGVRVEASEGAAVASFGAAVALERSTMECNFIDLNVETELGVQGEIADHGQNQCGCEGASIPCRAKSEGLAPPEPLPPPL
ncbi:right-handed parallel beta-helix repeat-containing protein [Sorangium sp. So ce269]